MSDPSLRLRRYLVTDPNVESPEQLVDICRSALRGGMTAIQLRSKGWNDRASLQAARALREICNEYNALLLINDRIDIALACQADGVHLGVEDLPVGTARKLLGPAAIIGYSPESAGDSQAENTANYLGIGPVYSTTTKTDAGAALGLEEFAERVQRTSLPVVGIGGITPARARNVIAAGAAGVAIVSAIFYAVNPEAAAQKLKEQIG